MKGGKITILILGVLYLCTGTELSIARQTNNVSFFINEDSKLRINGTSNVNDFECFYNAPISSDSVFQSVTFGDSLFFEGKPIQFKTSSFDCGKRAINRDLQKTLKADDFPFMELSIKTAEIADSVPFSSDLRVSIAGKTNIRPVTITAYSSSDSKITFSGNGQILLTDFGLEPPTALFGLVKVNDEIEINFELSIEL